MEVGTKVRVAGSLMVYHHPEHKSQPFDIQGQEGEVIANVTQWRGRPVSANFPYLVQFGPKFKVHLSDHEIEII